MYFKLQVLRKLHVKSEPSQSVHGACNNLNSDSNRNQADHTPKSKGIAIISRYPNSHDDNHKDGYNLITQPAHSSPPPHPAAVHGGGNGNAADEKSPSLPPRIVHDSTKAMPIRVKPEAPQPPSSSAITSSRNKENPVQCNEVTSSDGEGTPPPPPLPRRGPPTTATAPASGGVPSGVNARKSLSRELAALKQSNNTRLNENNVSTSPPPTTAAVDGPSKRTRRQSGPFPVVMTAAASKSEVVQTSKQQQPPLPSRRSIFIPKEEDSDAENNLPSHRQTRNSSGGGQHPVNSTNCLNGNAGNGNDMTQSKKPRGSPEVVSPRVLRPRNTPTPMKPDRKRQRSNENPNGISSKMLRRTATATSILASSAATRASTAAFKAAAAASTSRLKNLRRRMN